MTEHFSYEELMSSDLARRHGIPNIPGPEALDNLHRLAEFLEQVRSWLGFPLIVTSGFRSLAVNRMLRSKDTSQHVLGCAVDFKVKQMSPDHVVRKLKSSGLHYDQLIKELASWVHVSIPPLGATPRGEVLVINGKGTRLYEDEEERA